MVIEEGKFYFIKDEFFEAFKQYNLMENKEEGTKRPCYFCFRDRKHADIIWFVPISSKYVKYEKIYESKKEKIGNKAVYNFVFGEVLGKKAVFLIQNMFPTVEKYIEEKYTNSKRDVEISMATKKEILKIARRVIKLAEENIHIPFNNIIEMRSVMLDSIE